jgi:hypothetical protein
MSIHRYLSKHVHRKIAYKHRYVDNLAINLVITRLPFGPESLLVCSPKGSLLTPDFGKQLFAQCFLSLNMGLRVLKDSESVTKKQQINSN